MNHGVGVLALGVLGLWLAAQLLWMGPAEHAEETTTMFALGLVTGGVGLVSIVMLAIALVVGGPQPTLLKFAQGARTAAAVLGCTLIVVGLVHYRSTEPHGEIHWAVLGMMVLLAAGVVHWWLRRVWR